MSAVPAIGHLTDFTPLICSDWVDLTKLYVTIRLSERKPQFLLRGQMYVQPIAVSFAVFEQRDDVDVLR
jgi:hypothetical protein